MTLIKLDVRDGVGLIRLDNPPLNLITKQLIQELDAVLKAVATDDSVRSVVLTGSGARAFSAGSDVTEFPRLMDRGSVVEEKLAQENAAYSRLATLPQPSIAAIVGHALGGGAELSLCCDYRIMGESAQIGFPEIHLGTVPGSGGLSRLPRLVNPSTAMALVLDGDTIDARRAREIGLVNEVVASQQCVDAAMARARTWALRPAIAARAIKKAMLEISQTEVEAEIAASLTVSRSIFKTADMREGVSAFLQKRKPRFKHG
ncbi:MAG: enoyl-CoA hydratase/isomerase family protein [Hyphomicrobiales bacterium]|nr:enoyl-CoA hydratase/isomerase family protein [Hyphomicrobiales bacterium]